MTAHQALQFPVCVDCGKRHYRRYGTQCIFKREEAARRVEEQIDEQRIFEERGEEND